MTGRGLGREQADVGTTRRKARPGDPLLMVDLKRDSQRLERVYEGHIELAEAGRGQPDLPLGEGLPGAPVELARETQRLCRACDADLERSGRAKGGLGVAWACANRVGRQAGG